MSGALRRDVVILCFAVAAWGACRSRTSGVVPRSLPEVVAELAPGDLAGFVLDSITSVPVPNASIILGHDSVGRFIPLAPFVGALTDSLGRFHFRVAHPGAYVLAARSIGYRTRLLTVRLTDSTAAIVTLGLGRNYFSCPADMPKGTMCY